MIFITPRNFVWWTSFSLVSSMQESDYSVRISHKVHDHLPTFFWVKMIKSKIYKRLPSTNLQYTQAPTIHFLGLPLEKVITHIYLRNTRCDNPTSISGEANKECIRHSWHWNPIVTEGVYEYLLRLAFNMRHETYPTAKMITCFS